MRNAIVIEIGHLHLNGDNDNVQVSGVKLAVETEQETHETAKIIDTAKDRVELLKAFITDLPELAKSVMRASKVINEEADAEGVQAEMRYRSDITDRRFERMEDRLSELEDQDTAGELEKMAKDAVE